MQAVRSEKLAALQALEAELLAMQAEIAQYADSDPKKLEAMRAPSPGCSENHPSILLHAMRKFLTGSHSPKAGCLQAHHVRPPHACASPVHLLPVKQSLSACAGEATGIAKTAANRWLGESCRASAGTLPVNMAHTTADTWCCEAAC